MARGRMLNSTIATDDRLNALSPSAQRLWFYTLPHIDRDGLIDGRPPVLWAKAAPLQFDLMDITGQIISEWVACGLVVRYNGDRTPVLFFPAFQRNQVNMRYSHEAPSVFPPPPGFYRDDGGLRTLSDPTPDIVRTLSAEVGETGLQVKDQDQDEEKKNEEDAAQAPVPPSPSAHQDMFGAIVETCEPDLQPQARHDCQERQVFCSSAGYTPEQVRGFKALVAIRQAGGRNTRRCRPSSS